MKSKQLSTLSKEQQELQKLILEGLQSGTGPFADIFGKFDKEGFSVGVSPPANQQFQDEILPQLHEQYIGSNRGLSTARGAAATKAGADLQSKLAALLYQAQEQQKSNRIGGVQGLYGKQAVENVVTQPAPSGGGLSSFLGPLASVAGTALGGLFGGPVGASLGGATGSALGGMTSRQPSPQGTGWNLGTQVG